MRALVFALLAAAGPALADIEPGNWEMTVTTTFDGPAAGPGAGQRPADPGRAGDRQQAGALSSRVLGQPGGQVRGPAGVVRGVAVRTVEVQQVDRSGGGHAVTAGVSAIGR